MARQLALKGAVGDAQAGSLLRASVEGFEGVGQDLAFMLIELLAERSCLLVHAEASFSVLTGDGTDPAVAGR